MIEITFRIYDLYPNFKFQELTLLWEEQSPCNIFEQEFGTIFLLKWEVIKISKHLKQKSENGRRQTAHVDYVKTYVKDLGFINISQ